MGSLWGRTAPTTQHAETIYADILLKAGATIPIDAEADERAVLVAIGDAELDGQPMERFSLYVLKPGEPMTLRATSDARVMLLGGEALKPRAMSGGISSVPRATGSIRPRPIGGQGRSPKCRATRRNISPSPKCR